MTLIALFACALFACTTETPESEAAGKLTDRAYVVSNESNDLFVFDHATLEQVGSLDITAVEGAVNGNHMAMVTEDGAKVYVTAADQDMLVVVDAASMKVTKKM